MGKNKCNNKMDEFLAFEAHSSRKRFDGLVFGLAIVIGAALLVLTSLLNAFKNWLDWATRG